MKFNEQWLREWVNPALSSEELGHQITMAGMEVDAIEPVAGAFNGVVVGEIVEAEQHPDADKLRVCKVSAGGDELLQIVCGAPNARAGLKAPTFSPMVQYPSSTRATASATLALSLVSCLSHRPSSNSR